MATVAVIVGFVVFQQTPAFLLPKQKQLVNRQMKRFPLR
jgi:hypothetical protein